MKRIRGLTIDEYQHPLDKAAVISLQNIPVLSNALDFVSGMMERFAVINRTGSGLRISLQSYPELYKEFQDVADTLGVESLPRLYLQFGYDLHVSTDGDRHPITILNSGIVDLLSAEERRFYFGHELGHIVANHLGYLILCRYWPIIDRMVPGSSLLAMPLMHFSRMTEFTADRVALLACQDINIAISTMMKQAGIPRKYYKDIKIEALIQQIEDFKVMREQIAGGILEDIALLDNTMPWIVNRASYLLDWYYNGNYSELLEKHGV